jgi:hypothetical protein
MHIFVALTTGQTLMMIGAVGGDLLWLLAYILIIRKGFQDKTYGVPLLALALNFTWEFLYTIQFPPSDWPHIVLRWSWLLADFVIVYQYFRYGKETSEIPSLRQYFYPISIFVFINAYIFQLTYRYHFYASNGYENAFLINFLMSMLFVQFFFLRSPGLLGLSYGAAWAKMAGTAMLAVVYALQRRQPMFRYSFMMFLYLSTFLYDVIYIALLAMARHAASRRLSASPTNPSLAA